MYKILTLNNISVSGLDRLPREMYEVASEITRPDGILVRSANMHDMEIPETVQAIGRAGAGVNNIPVAELSGRGVPVFNAPGANANAVKELVVAGMLLAARNIAQSWRFARSLEGDDGTIRKEKPDWPSLEEFMASRDFSADRIRATAEKLRRSSEQKTSSLQKWLG